MSVGETGEITLDDGSVWKPMRGENGGTRFGKEMKEDTRFKLIRRIKIPYMALGLKWTHRKNGRQGWRIPNVKTALTTARKNGVHLTGEGVGYWGQSDESKVTMMHYAHSIIPPDQITFGLCSGAMCYKTSGDGRVMFVARRTDGNGRADDFFDIMRYKRNNIQPYGTIFESAQYPNLHFGVICYRTVSNKHEWIHDDDSREYLIVQIRREAWNRKADYHSGPIPKTLPKSFADTWANQFEKGAEAYANREVNALKKSSVSSFKTAVTTLIKDAKNSLPTVASQNGIIKKAAKSANAEVKKEMVAILEKAIKQLG